MDKRTPSTGERTADESVPRRHACCRVGDAWHHCSQNRNQAHRAHTVPGRKKWSQPWAAAKRRQARGRRARDSAPMAPCLREAGPLRSLGSGAPWLWGRRSVNAGALTTALSSRGGAPLTDADVAPNGQVGEKRRETPAASS